MDQVTSPNHWQPQHGGPHHQHVGKPKNSPSGGGGSSKLEALDNLVISTIFSISTKLCLTSGKVIKRLQEQTEDKEHVEYLDTLLYVLEDVDPPMSPSKKTSRELAGTLRNLKKVEQALQTLLTSTESDNDQDDDEEEDDCDDDDDDDQPGGAGAADCSV